MKSGKVKLNFPIDAIDVTTYAELDRYLSRFAAGELDLLLLLGRNGTGKTESVRRALRLDDDAGSDAVGGLYVEGHAQPYGLYRQLWEHRDRPVVLDDLDRLYADADCIRLLKPLCNGRPIKRIAWCSNATLQSRDVPPQFNTRSTVVLIANEWRTLNPNVRALEDRAIILHFDPPADEVHRKAAMWFDDAEVYEFIGRHLDQVPAVSLRYYEKGRKLRRAGFGDWRKSLLLMMLPDRGVAVVTALQLDPCLSDDRERIEVFARETGLSRSSYYRLKRGVTANRSDPTSPNGQLSTTTHSSGLRAPASPA